MSFLDKIKLINKKVKRVKIINKTVFRRQDAPKTFDMNASIYIWNRKTLMNSGNGIAALSKNIKEKVILYEMPDSRSIDIDSELDFKIVEFLLKKEKKW